MGGSRQPTVLHKTALVTVFCGDARDVLPTLGTESMDCVVTDPPYGMAWQSNTRTVAFGRIIGDGNAEQAMLLLGDVTPDLVRVTRRSRHIYAFGLAMTHPLLPPAAQATLVWNKEQMGSGDVSHVWGPSHEPVFFHRRAEDLTNAKRGKGSQVARLRRGTVLSVPRLGATQVKRHPTEKPVALLAQLIEASTLRGEVVLDPFGGVGSTAVAAILTGRRAVVIELDEGYAALTVERVKRVEALMTQAAAA